MRVVFALELVNYHNSWMVYYYLYSMHYCQHCHCDEVVDVEMKIKLKHLSELLMSEHHDFENDCVDDHVVDTTDYVQDGTGGLR